MKVPVAQTVDYTIYYEKYLGKTYTHADVERWTKGVRVEFTAVHKVLSALHGEPFYALVDNPKLEKFVKQLGYVFYATAHCVDGVHRTVWIYYGE